MNAYQDKDFNYDFPEGLSELLNNQKIIAITTPEGDNLLIEVIQNEELPENDFDNEIDQFISFESEDELLILSHADFTQICHFKKGNCKEFRWPIQKSEGFDKGTYHFNIGIEDVSNEYEKYEAYYKVTITIKKVESMGVKNKVVEII